MRILNDELLAAFVFDQQGKVIKVILFGPRESGFGVDIPAGVWRTVVHLNQALQRAE